MGPAMTAAECDTVPRGRTGMPKKRYTLSDLRDVIESGSIDVKLDDDQWEASGDYYDPIGTVWACPCETIADAVRDCGESLQRRVADVLLSQLTHYQVAIILSTIRLDRGQVLNWNWSQDIPDTAAPRSLVILEDDGLLELSPQSKHGDRCLYTRIGQEDHSVRSSGWKLSDVGKSVLAELRGTELIDHPRVQSALGRLRWGARNAQAPAAVVQA